MKSEQRVVNNSTNTVLINAMYGSAAYPASGLLKNPGPATLYLGGHGVTSSSGFPLETDDFIEVDVVNEHLYGICTTTQTIYILRRGD